MKNGQKQLNWSQANETRLVTKCRYIIEVINRIFKQQFEALKETQNSMLSHIFDDYRIAASLINGFFSERISDKEDVEEIAQNMKKKLKLRNDMEKYFELRLTSSQNLFTKIEEYYQLERAFGYLFKHFSANEDYEFLVSNNLENDE
ncbi:unnamed protein product, partial [Brachionus calyciflorus]